VACGSLVSRRGQPPGRVRRSRQARAAVGHGARQSRAQHNAASARSFRLRARQPCLRGEPRLASRLVVRAAPDRCPPGVIADRAVGCRQRNRRRGPQAWSMPGYARAPSTRSHPLVPIRSFPYTRSHPLVRWAPRSYSAPRRPLDLDHAAVAHARPRLRRPPRRSPRPQARAPGAPRSPTRLDNRAGAGARVRAGREACWRPLLRAGRSRWQRTATAFRPWPSFAAALPPSRSPQIWPPIQNLSTS